MYANLHKTIISNTFHTDAPYKTRAGAGEKAANGLAPVALHSRNKLKIHYSFMNEMVEIITVL